MVFQNHGVHFFVVLLLGKKIPDWERLWDEFIQEEIKVGSK
jgi:hypothetical protein